MAEGFRNFTVCMASFSFKSDKFECHSNFIEHNRTKTLIMNPSNVNVNSTFFRIRKYLSRGFTIHYDVLENIISKITIFGKGTTHLQRKLLRLVYRNELLKLKYIHYQWDSLSGLTEALDTRFLEENLDNSTNFNKTYY